jgi:hypothetical protein
MSSTCIIHYSTCFTCRAGFWNRNYPVPCIWVQVHRYTRITSNRNRNQINIFIWFRTRNRNQIGIFYLVITIWLSGSVYLVPASRERVRILHFFCSQIRKSKDRNEVLVDYLVIWFQVIWLSGYGYLVPGPRLQVEAKS